MDASSLAASVSANHRSGVAASGKPANRRCPGRRDTAAVAQDFFRERSGAAKSVRPVSFRRQVEEILFVLQMGTIAARNRPGPAAFRLAA